MLNVAKKSDLQGVTICFLLDVFWDNQTYRFSTFDVTIFEDTTPYYYDGSLGEIDIDQALTDEISPEGDAIPIEIVFTDRDLVKLRLMGFSLDFQKVELYYVTVRNGIVLQSYDERIPLSKGQIVDPIFGQIDQPVGYVTFSIENGKDIEATPLLTGSDVISIGNGKGKFRPIIIGEPCKNIITENEIDSIPTSPCYYYVSGTQERIYIASHPVMATMVNITDQDGNNSNRTVYNRPNHAYVLVSGSGLTVDNSSKTKIFAKWYDGGGLRNPATGESISGGGDLLRYMLQLSGYDIDNDALEGVRVYLNTWRFDGWINEELDTIEFIENNLQNVLPFSLHNGPRGIRPILDLFNAVNQQKPITTIEDNADFLIVSGLEPDRGIDDLCNNLILRCGYSAETQGYTMTIEIDPRVDLQDVSNTKYSTVYADASFNRYGLKTKIIEHDFIGDYKTASSIAQDYIRRHAFVPLKITVEANVAWGWLDLGDIVQIKSDRLSFEKPYLCQVIRKKWTGTNWIYDLRLNDSGLQNIRPESDAAKNVIADYDGWYPDSTYDSTEMFVWMDGATDLRTSGGIVVDWTDRANGYVFQKQAGNNNTVMTGANSPTAFKFFALGLKNYKYVRFDHTQHQFLATGFRSKMDLSSTNGLCIAMLVRAYADPIGDTYASTQRAIILNCGRGYSLAFRTGSVFNDSLFYYAGGSNSDFVNNQIKPPTDLWKIVIYNCSKVTGYTGETGFYTNGGYEKNTNYQASNYDMTINPNFRIGRSYDINYLNPTAEYSEAFGSFDLAEMLVFSIPLHDAERQKVEGYLAHRWGKTSLLPASHPYKNTVPT